MTRNTKHYRLTGRLAAKAAVLFVLASAAISHAAGDARDEQIARLESQMTAIAGQVQDLKADREADAERQAEYETLIDLLRADMERIEARGGGGASWVDKFTISGYGEMHANFIEGGGGGDKFDLHRIVLYMGYEFADWITLHSEFEIEHGFVSSGAGGELVIEQLYVDFEVFEQLNFRVGRILTPLGIINKNHEPTKFLGVERPSFAKYIIPSTWSSDGAGIFGTLFPWLTYELYIVGGLDGTEFSAIGGIRGGRIKERPSLQEPAVTGRLDIYPLVGRAMPYDQELRFGVSGYYGGLDNGNSGSNPGIDGKIHIYSADFEYTVSRFDFRGAIAYETISGANDFGSGTAEGIFGWYAEGGYHFWPASWRVGKLAQADAVAFVRFDRFDTQHKMPKGAVRDPAGDRSEWTFGVNFYPVPNFVIKADYQILHSEAESDLPSLFNMGIGWEF